MATLDELLGQTSDQEASLKMLAVSDVNPELAAKSVKQARANNIPPALTPFEPDPDIEIQERTRRISSTLQRSPVLPKWMRQQPDVVVASVQDDVENMGAIDALLDTPFIKGVRDTFSAAKSGYFGIGKGGYGAIAIPFGALRSIAEPFSGTRAQIPLLPVNPFAAAEEYFLEKARGQQALADLAVADRSEYGFVASSALAGVESIGQTIPALAGAIITKNPAFATQFLSTTVAGQSYAEAREKLDPLQAVSYGTLQGAIEYWTEKIPMSALIKSINADDTLLQTLGKQLATEIPGEQVATVLQDLNEWANLNPDKPFKDYIAERPEAAAGTLIATIVGVSGNVAITKTIGAFIDRDNSAQKANETATLLGELNKLATASVVRERDVDTFEGFLQSVTQDTPVESLYIDAQTLIDSGLANKLASESPTVAAQIDQASAGTMIRIPTAEVMGRFNQELAPLLPEMRTDPNGMNQREAEEYVNNRGEELRTQVETVLAQDENEQAAQEARAAVRDTVAQELMATGRVTKDVADNYALLTSTFYHVMARRMGMNASELFGQERLRIAGAGRGEFEQARNIKSLLRKNGIPIATKIDADRLWSANAQIYAFPDLDATPVLVTSYKMLDSYAPDQLMYLPAGFMQTDITSEAAQALDEEADAESDDVAEITQSDIPESVDDASALDSALNVAKGKIWAKGRDLKLAIQNAVQEAARAAGVDVGAPSEQTTQYLIRVGVRDALLALKQNPNAIGWYDLKTRQALAIMARVHPEIETDENARFAFVWALAVTSNGIKVDKNFELAEQVYEHYKRTGEMPTNVQAGQAQKAINKSLALFNELRAAWGEDNLRLFMLTNFTVGEIASLEKKLKPGGEHAATIVKGAAILGPKIGNGFFSNLYGNFDSLTMDRWLVRTWGRWTGTLIKEQPAQTAAARTRLQNALDAALKDEQVAADLSKAIGVDLTADMNVDELAVAIQEASMLPALREDLNKTEAGVELRKAGNSLAKYLDGQKEAPAGPNERNYIRQVFGDILSELQAQPEYQDLTMADLQAVLWYAEKRLYETAKEDIAQEDETEGYADEEAPDYANAAAAVARKKGVSDRKIQATLKQEADRGRTADAGLATGEARQDIEQEQIQTRGFTRQQKRSFIGAIATHRARSNRVGDAQSSFAYQRKGRPDTGRLGVLKKLGVTWSAEWKPGRGLGNIYRRNGFAVPKFYELGANDPKNAAQFAAAITAAKQSNGPIGAAVYVYPESDYQNMRLFLSEDGKAGVAIKPDGDIVSVFSSKGANSGRAIMELAVAAGGTKLDAFDTILPDFYAAHGFRAVSRLTWDDEQAPEGWDKAAFSEFNNGEPDVVFMVYDPAYFGKYSKDDGRRFTGKNAYGRAVNLQTSQQVGAPQQFFQGEAQEVRGSFSPSELTIRLTKAQDLSTFLHESGHFYLHMLVNLASRPDAPVDVRKDAETILNWFGVEATPEMNQFDVWLNMSTDEQRPSHERFARGFEVYLAEGKAPSTELQPMFDRFRSWLLNVYRSLMERAKATFGKQVSFGKAMQAELNDEVRAVFDRLLATQEEIEAKEAAQSMGMLFKTEEEARKFGIDWQAYQAQGEAATQQAVTELTAKSVQDMKWLENARSRMLSKLQREERDTRRSVRSAVRPEIMSQPIYQAWAYLTGPLTDDPNAEPTSRFDPEYVEQVTASKEVLAQLRKRRMVATSADIKNGVSGEHPDVVAEHFGFSSGYELIEAILASPSPEEAINAETDARMLRDFSDLSTEEGRNDAVNAALANDARTRMVETELSALEKAMSPRAMIGGRRQNTLPGAARNFARAVINRLKIRDVRVGQYSGSASRAAKNADRAIKKGNVQEAALEKRNQLVNTYAAKFAGEALDNVKRGVAYLKKFSKGGTRQNIDVEYLDQIDRILERFDLRPRTLRELDKRDALAKFVEDQKELGIEPDLPDYILNEAQAVNYKNLTVEEFAGLVDSVRQIEHLGRLKRKLLLAKDKREFDALMKEIRESVIANDRGRVADNRTRTDLGSIMSRAFKAFTAAHRKMASIVYEIDGFKDGGPLWDALVRTANERGNWEASKQAELTTRLAQLLKGLPKERAFSKGRFFPRINTSLNQEGRLAVALNWGNEGNRQRLMDGRGWNAEGVQQVLDSLSQQEWDFVQGVWDTFESLRPDIAQVERNLMGKEPEWIEATPIQTKFGTYRGGYYPAVYDPAESLRTEQLSAEEEAKRQLRGARTAATVRSNFVKGRAAEVKGRPILLTMDATFNGLTDVVHYLAYKEWLVDANRILRAVDGTIRERYGAEMTRQLRTAVEAIAAGEATNPHALDKPLRHIRIGSMVAGLGFNIVNAVMQPLGLTQSIVRIGPKYVAQGVAEFAKNPVKLATKVMEKSVFMQNRKRTQNRELNDLRNGLRGKTESRQFIDGAMFLPMTAIQMTVDIPTWWGAYQKAQTEGFDEDTSIQIADQAVLASQGGGQMKDLAAIQRGSEFVKIFTVFYGYFNTAYNLGVERIRGTNPRSPAQIARLATDLLLIYSVPAVLGMLIKEAFKIGDEDDDEEIAQKLAAEQVSFLFGTMVGVREAAGAAQIMFGLSTSGGLGYSGPAGLRFFNELNKFSQQANQGELDRAFVRAGVNVAGIALHLPSAQINRTIDGVIAMSEGRTQNPVALVGGAPPQ